MASPKLKKFLSDYSETAKIFTNAVSNAFSNKTVRLYYFYSDNDSEARCFHFYPNRAGMPEVVLCVRENQAPLDEFICVLFETLNSKNESEFWKLFQDASLGNISREQYAKEILQHEFEATKNTRAILLTLKFEKKETGESHYYREFAECPTNFDDFLTYSKKLSQDRDVLKEYELQYGSLRKMYIDSNSSSNSPAKN